MRNPTRCQGRQGVAAVELAFILPILVLFVVGVWEVGRMVEVQQLLTNAAREGGRQASIGSVNTQGVKDAVKRYLSQNGIPTVTDKDITVTNLTDASRADPTQANQLDRFQVVVTIPFSSVRWAVMNQVTTTKNLVGSADWYSMRDIPITVNNDPPLN
jgi:Flp pilus assembly protein TadG